MKTEVRVIDCNYFSDSFYDNELYRTIDRFLNNGWTVLKIFEPMKYKDSDDYFSRIIFTKTTN